MDIQALSDGHQRSGCRYTLLWCLQDFIASHWTIEIISACSTCRYMYAMLIQKARLQSIIEDTRVSKHGPRVDQAGRPRCSLSEEIRMTRCKNRLTPGALSRTHLTQAFGLHHAASRTARERPLSAPGSTGWDSVGETREVTLLESAVISSSSGAHQPENEWKRSVCYCSAKVPACGEQEMAEHAARLGQLKQGTTASAAGVLSLTGCTEASFKD